MLGLILLLDEDGETLHIGASSSLPKDYLDEIEGLKIGPMVGSCGTAAYSGKRVIVTDIQDRSTLGWACEIWQFNMVCARLLV